MESVGGLAQTRQVARDFTVTIEMFEGNFFAVKIL